MKKFYGLFFLIFLVLLYSCDNFLNGSDLKEQLDSKISYANKQYVSVDISADSDAIKSMIPAVGEYLNKYKEGDSIKLKLENKTAYTFVGWTCEPEGAVVFAKPEQLETEAVISGKSANIKIYPLLSLIPTVESFYPTLEQSGFPQDTTILIKFNKPVDLSNFDNFNNISITSDNVSLISDGNRFFQNPVAIDDRTLEIKALQNKNIISPGVENVTKDIIVSLHLNKLKDKENIEFEIGDLDFTYRINSGRDNKPPVIVSSLVAQKALPQVLLENKTPENIPLESFETYSSKPNLEVVFEQHHVGAKIRLYAQFKDEESGIKAFRIKEKLLMKTDSTPVSGAEEFTTQYFFNTDLPEVFSYDTVTKTYTYSEDYSFYTADDGLIALNIEVEDYVGNVTSFTPVDSPLEIIKDTYKIWPNLRRIGNDFVSGDIDEFEVIISDVSWNFPQYFKYDGKTYFKYRSRLSGTADYDNYLNKTHYQLYVSTDETNWTQIKEQRRGILNEIMSNTRTDRYPAYIYSLKRDPHTNLHIKTIAIDCVGNIFEGDKYCIQKTSNILKINECEQKLDMNCVELTIEEEPVGSYMIFAAENKTDSPLFALPSNYLRKTLSFGIQKDAKVILPYNDFIKDNTDYHFYIVPTANPNNISMEDTNYYVDVNSRNQIQDFYKDNPLNILKDSTYPRYFYDRANNYSTREDIVTTYLYGSLSDPYVYNKNTTGYELPDSVVPKASQIIITEKPVVPNSGIHEATISYTNDFIENPDYIYIIREVDTDGKILQNFATKNISSVGNYTTYWVVVAFDGKGNEKVSESKNYVFKGDIKAPSIASTSITPSYSDYTNSIGNFYDIHWKVSANRYDSLCEIAETDMTQIKKVLYLLTNNSKINITNYKDYEFYPCILNDKKFSIQLDDRYFDYAYIVIEDQTGNTHFERTNFNITHLNKFYTYTIKDNTMTLSVPDNYSSETNYMVNCYPGSARFILTDLKTNNSINVKGSHNVTDIDIDLDEIIKKNNTFIKVESEVYNLPFKVNKTNTQYTKVAYFPYTTYFCPGYNEKETPCNLKNVIKGEMGLSILCDQVTFAHTLYSVKNYGKDVSQNDYAVWETKGYEANTPVVRDSSFTYTEPEILEGYWYTTIVHFADGSIYQTTPVKK